MAVCVVIPPTEDSVTYTPRITYTYRCRRLSFLVYSFIQLLSERQRNQNEMWTRCSQ